MELADRLYQAACDGDETAVRKLLAAGARADQANEDGWLPLHFASSCSHEGEAAPSTASVTDNQGQTAVHHAVLGWSFLRYIPAAAVAVARLLLQAAPATALAMEHDGWTPLHRAAERGNIEALTLLLEVAPELAFAPDAFGETALHQVLRCGHSPADRVLEMARCLVRAAPAVQPALGILLHTSRHSTLLFADLVARLPLSQ